MTIKTKAVAVRRGNKVIEGAEAIEIDSDIAYKDAAGFLMATKALKKEVLEFMAPVVKKTNEAHKAATAARKKLLEPIEMADAIVRKKMLTFQSVRDREAKQLAEKVLEETESEVMAEAAASAAVVPDVSGIGKTTTPTWEIVDESLIKAEFMVPDTVRINKAVRSFKKDAERIVGGIKVTEKKGLRV